MRGLARTVVALVVAWSAAGCAGMGMYYRGTPKRVDTQVSTGQTVVTVDVERTSSDELYAVVFEHTDLQVTRKLVYTTVLRQLEHVWYWEFVEVPVGAVFIAIAPFSRIVLAASPDTQSQVYKQPQYTLAVVFGPINPFQAGVAGDWTTYYDSDEYVFESDSKTASFQKSRPVEGAPVAYAWKDAAGAVVTHGQGTTDPFGRVLVDPPPTGQERLEVRLGDGPPVPIDPAVLTTTPGAPPAGVAPPPAAASGAPPGERPSVETRFD